jgi:hypothetical protein
MGRQPVTELRRRLKRQGCMPRVSHPEHSVATKPVARPTRRQFHQHDWVWTPAESGIQSIGDVPSPNSAVQLSEKEAGNNKGGIGSNLFKMLGRVVAFHFEDVEGAERASVINDRHVDDRA